MKKILLIVLVIIAIPLYTWNVYLVIRTMAPNENSPNVNNNLRKIFTVDDVIGVGLTTHFVEKGKSPFTAYKELPKLIAKNQTIQQSTNPKPHIIKETINPPAITINGIMWNPANPVAMLTLPDGSSVVGKPGQVFGEITVKKVDRGSITVVYRGKAFVITR